jgi:Creatinase/Prolidase N-terminal domain
MRRGLISRSPVEMPDAVFDARLECVRVAMRQAKLDALIIYTNNTRPAGVSWLTGFVPYWSEALLVVPRDAAPYLVAALTLRVKTWIERVSRLGDVLHNPRVGLKAAEQIASARKNAAVGVVDFDGLPAGIADDLRTGGPELMLTDASALFAALRGRADPAEIALAHKATSIAHRSLKEARGETLNAMIAAVERHARLLGAEEIYIAAAADLARGAHFRRIEGDAALGESCALRATVAYKGTWVRLVRACCEAALAREAAARFAQAVAQLPSDRGFASGFDSYLVEGCRIAQPLEPLMGSRLDGANPPMPGALVSVAGTIAIGGRSIPVGAPVLLGRDGEAASLLIDPLYD